MKLAKFFKVIILLAVLPFFLENVSAQHTFGGFSYSGLNNEDRDEIESLAIDFYDVLKGRDKIFNEVFEEYLKKHILPSLRSISGSSAFLNSLPFMVFSNVSEDGRYLSFLGSSVYTQYYLLLDKNNPKFRDKFTDHELFFRENLNLLTGKDIRAYITKLYLFTGKEKYPDCYEHLWMIAVIIKLGKIFAQYVHPNIENENLKPCDFSIADYEYPEGKLKGVRIARYKFTCDGNSPTHEKKKKVTTIPLIF